MHHFVYKLIPPRETFVADMTEAEQAIMGEHAAYWTDLFQSGQVVVYGVAIMEQTGPWGLAVVEAETADDVHAMAAGDPAVKSQVCTYDIGVMPSPSVRPRLAAA